MNRAAPEPRIPEPRNDADAVADATPIAAGAGLNGGAPAAAPFAKAADGHALIQVNGVTVDPRTVEGLVAYHIGKQYKGRPVVRDVSIGVQRGEVVGLLGPNGAGKTTCFYVITGLIKADAGAIYLDGEEVTDLPMYQRARGGIGYLPQEASVFRGMSVEDNIMTVLEVTERDRSKRKPLVDRLLAEFSIEHLRRTPAMALSGGERRRVEIARCVAMRPNYVLLDEPLAGIDPIAVGDVRDIVTHLKDRGIGVLITDHNVRDTLEIVDRAYILHEGHVLREGSPRDIVRDPQVRRVYLGERFSL
jgi:lipopolysaccharide export system ATP-binding protein